MHINTAHPGLKTMYWLLDISIQILPQLPNVTPAELYKFRYVYKFRYI